MNDLTGTEKEILRLVAQGECYESALTDRFGTSAVGKAYVRLRSLVHRRDDRTRDDSGEKVGYVRWLLTEAGESLVKTGL